MRPVAEHRGTVADRRVEQPAHLLLAEGLRQALRAPAAARGGRRDRRRARPSSARNRWSARTGTIVRATDAGASPRARSVGDVRDEVVLGDIGERPALLAQPRHVGAEVAPVGGDGAGAPGLAPPTATSAGPRPRSAGRRPRSPTTGSAAITESASGEREPDDRLGVGDATVVDHRERLVERDALDGHGVLLLALAIVGDVGEAAGRGTATIVSSVHARRVVEGDEVLDAAPRPARPPRPAPARRRAARSSPSTSRVPAGSSSSSCSSGRRGTGARA